MTEAVAVALQVRDSARRCLECGADVDLYFVLSHLLN